MSTFPSCLCGRLAPSAYFAAAAAPSPTSKAQRCPDTSLDQRSNAPWDHMAAVDLASSLAAPASCLLLQRCATAAASQAACRSCSPEQSSAAPNTRPCCQVDEGRGRAGSQHFISHRPAWPATAAVASSCASLQLASFDSRSTTKDLISSLASRYQEADHFLRSMRS